MPRSDSSESSSPSKRPAVDIASVTSSDESSRKRQRKRRRNGKKKDAVLEPEHDLVLNGQNELQPTQSFARRRDSLGKAARDPRDEPSNTKKVVKKPIPNGTPAVVAARPIVPIFDDDGLSRPSRGTKARRDETSEQAQERLDKMCGAVRTLLECVGEDVDREGLLRTPLRYSKALLDFTDGYQQNIEDIVNGALFHEGHNEMVIVKDIEINSLCEHHLVPFTGKMHIGYIPAETVIGLSKLPRIAEMYARRLQVQERLTKEVAHAIMEILKPQGVAVVMESKHLCMCMRGVQKSSSSTITSCVLGCFERKSKTRSEFLSLVGFRR